METPTPVAQPSRPPLYHYSDAGGFIGMLTSRSLWFSHIKYLNDADEWFYALRLFEQVLQEYNGFSNLRNPYDYIKGTSFLHNHFTFSFSEQKDLLSQWRGYCPNGGYSFCIEDWHLDQMAQEHGLVFEPCIYDEEEQKEFIRTRIIGIKPESLAKQRESDNEQRAKGYHLRYDVDRINYDISQGMIHKFKLLCLLKHPSFKEEREWRMVVSVGNNSKLRNSIKLRTSRNMLIPYIDLSIPAVIDALDENRPNDPRRSRWKIKEVVVGPQPHQELAIAACKLVIPPYIWNYPGAVISSAIPYVNW